MVSLGERDCSAQRRNQKVVEECPASNLSVSLSHDLFDTAERLLASVNYRNAGTVEFLLHADTVQYYFLEVNTRLQVEHGVTEMVFDLVEWMVKQAANTLAAPSGCAATPLVATRWRELSNLFRFESECTPRKGASSGLVLS